jgi:hypothetical protein
MKCRKDCGACCIAISISSPIPGMPEGKPAGHACLHLDPVTKLCRIWEKENYPQVCREFRPSPEFCGHDRASALHELKRLEELTDPEEP